MSSRRLSFGAFALLIAASLLLSQPLMAQTLAEGWRERDRRTNVEERIFEATTVSAGEFLTVQESALRSLDGASLKSWITSVATADSPPEGRWLTVVTPTAQASTLATVVREFSRASGGRGAVLYAAASGDQKLARVLRATFSSMDLIRSSQGQAAKQLMVELATKEIADGRSGVPRTAVASVPTPTGIPGTRTEPSKAAGRWLQPNQLETVFYHWDIPRYDAFQGMVMDEAVYLLLKDGTAYSGFPAAMQEFDVATSRQTEPGRWGRWRKTGAKYAFSWRSDSGTYREERGNPVSASPAGTSLQGHFVSGSTYKFPGGGVDMTFLNDVTFTSDGRFSANGETSGTYRIDGYSIELRHSTGKVERRTFFIDGDGIWFMGGRMIRKK
jgi:hypothetical protein